jgi:hypothetical protein
MWENYCKLHELLFVCKVDHFTAWYNSVSYFLFLKLFDDYSQHEVLEWQSKQHKLSYYRLSCIYCLLRHILHMYSSICTSKHSQPVPLLFTVSCLYQLSIHHVIKLILLQQAYRCGMNTVNYFLISLHFCTKHFFTNFKQCYLNSVQSFIYFIPFLFHKWNGYSVTEAGYIVTVKEFWNWVMSCLSEARVLITDTLV